MPVLADIVDPDFFKKPINGAMVPHSRLTHLPVLAGIVGPDFTKKPIKGRGYRTR